MRRIGAGLLSLTLACASTLAAQSKESAISDSAAFLSLDPSIDLGGSRQCLASIPSERMRRTTIFLHATMPAHTDAALTLQAELMAENVATELRRRLGARGVEVPMADSFMTWFGASSRLVVTAYPDGSVGRRVMRSSGDSSAASILLQAFDSARAHGGAMMFWPENLKADSLIVRLAWDESLTRNLRALLAPGSEGLRFPVFSIAAPALESPAFLIAGQGQPSYPRGNASRRMVGALLLQFVVDTAGRVEASTIKDLWPRDKPKPAGDLGWYYNEFVESVTTWVKRARFTPARVGNCAVRQVVKFPVKFKMDSTQTAVGRTGSR